MKKYLKILIVPFVAILLFPLLLSILNLLKIETSNITILVLMIISSFITGILIGHISSNKAYLKGLLGGVIISLIYFLISLLWPNNYQINTLIYYLVLIFSSTIGSMIGIQKKDR